ncbi:MAG: polyphosphate kinase 2 family protein, partial [Acidobacteriota bacterium]|nr:polyphosphate kinase 2 family protein [Acidobacteriota bacterium]
MANKLPDPSALIKPYCFSGAKDFDLGAFDPTDTQNLDIKNQAGDLLQQRIGQLSRLQQKLYADGNWGVLLIFQSMDAGGKDSVIRHVLSGVNPEGYRVYS